MSKPVIITADSTCDLSPELLERYQIRTIPLTILLGEESFRDGLDFTPDDMYRRYHQGGTLPKTAAPSVQDFLDFFGPLLEQGYEIVHLDISAELSGTFNAANIAAQELGGVYPVDSLPEHFQYAIGYNPVYVSIVVARRIILEGRVPEYTLWIKLAVYGLGSFLIGYWIFVRNENKVMQKM